MGIEDNTCGRNNRGIHAEKMNKMEERSAGFGNAFPSSADTGEDDKEWLFRLEQVVKANMGDPQFGIDSLVSLMGMRRTYFYRRVRSTTGMSANAYVQEIRLRTARELLESGQAGSLKTLCEQVGLRTPRYFSRLYRERFGRSPAVELRR
jgi:AraC-like DNA-binding protein